MIERKKLLPRAVVASGILVATLSMGLVGLSGVSGASTTSTTSAPSQAQRAALCSAAKARPMPRIESAKGFFKRAKSYEAQAARLEASASKTGKSGKSGKAGTNAKTGTTATTAKTGTPSLPKSVQRRVAYLEKAANHNKEVAARLRSERSKAKAALSADVSRYCSAS
jgi:hypothetical protein